MNNNPEADNVENEEEQNLAYLPADHPLLQRFQRAMQQQLTDEHERVDLELIEIEENLKKVEREKEDVGVQLYGVQQQLAENQMNFENTNENYNLVQRLRIESEQKKEQMNDVYNQKKKEIEDIRKKYLKQYDEMSRLNRTLKTIEQHNQEIDGAIKVAQRTTLRAEENVVQLEKEKKKQDVLIDQMNEQIKRLEEQKTILTAQLLSQKEETEQAQGILREAQLEMQRIISSKKNLLEKWQKSIFNMQRRDNALQAIKDAMDVQKEVNIQLGTELIGIDGEIRKEDQVNEVLNQQNVRLKKEIDGLENERQKKKHDKEKLEAQYRLLQKSLKNTEQQIKKVELKQKETDDQMNLIENNIMSLHSASKKLFEKLINNISEHKNIEKTAANLQKQAMNIALEIEDKEVELENLMNEISRVQLDSLNTGAQIEVLDKKKQEVMTVKYNQELMVERFEMMIRQGHDLNEKKQNEVGRLNKVYDELQSNVDSVGKSPQEVELGNIRRNNEEKEQQLESMEKEWTNKQAILVKFSNNRIKLEDKVNHLQTKQTILEQKKQRLNNSYNTHVKEIKDVNKGLFFLDKEMERLNDVLSVYLQQKLNLESENYNINSEFIQKLKQLEQQAVVYEVQIDRLREEKAELLQEIVESERQILLWERKITLERDMQSTLNPDVGKDDIVLLKQEIHRMELRLDDLRKKQESMMQDMERAVYKRETIQVKYLKKHQQQQSQKGGTQIGGQIKALKNQLSNTLNNSRQLDGAIRNRLTELNNINGQFEESREQYQLLEQQVNEKNMNLNQTKLLKLINIYKIAALQNEARSIDSFLQGKHKIQFQEAQLKKNYDDILQTNNGLKEIMVRISVEQPHFNFILEPVLDII